MKLACFLLIAASVSMSAQTCRWGLVKTTDCDSVEVEAAERMASAKTACLSSDSGVWWPKNLRNPGSAGTLAEIGRAFSYAKVGYEGVRCADADLIFKFQVQKTDSVNLEVFDADSGDRVFYESRSLTDEAADLHRLALHFKQAHRTATSNKIRWDWDEKNQTAKG